MPGFRRAIQRLPADLARKRDFDIVADARHLEMLRQALRREIRVHTSLRALALQIGVDRGTLRKFLAMESVPRSENLEKIRDWAADRPEVWTPIESVALSILVLDLPAQSRAHIRRQLIANLASAFPGALPAWLEQECSL